MVNLLKSISPIYGKWIVLPQLFGLVYFYFEYQSVQLIFIIAMAYRNPCI